MSSRRDQLISAAIQAGKFPPERRAHWQTVYDRDPAGTEQVLAVLAPGLMPANTSGSMPLGGGRGNTATAGLTLAGSSQPVAHADLTPEVVASWSQELFPETRRGNTYRSRITQHPGD